MELGLALALFGAAIAVGLAGIGTIFGTAFVAGGGSGLLAKDAKLFGRILIFSAVPSSQGLYGFLIAVIISQNIGIFGGEIPALTFAEGLGYLAAGIPVGILGFFSGAMQGKVLQAGLKVLITNPSESSKALILGVLVETMAVFGFLISFLMISWISRL